MMELRLPRLICDGMVLQQKQNCRIWGWDIPGRKIEIFFLNKVYETFTEENGSWKVVLESCMPGGPYEMKIQDDAGVELIISNIMVGDVWFCSGQSNMELPMERVKDAFPKEIADCTNSNIRTFKITEYTNFHAPQEELQTGEWKEANADTILAFSATAYFFARALYKMTGVAVGLINASLGGSLIESWMGRDMLEGYAEQLALADKYGDDAFVKKQQEKNQVQSLEWHTKLDEADVGMTQHWEAEEEIWKNCAKVNVPFFFQDTDLKNFIGSVWFHKNFSVSEEMASKEANLWLGTIVDSDTAYINGVEVGRTEYQYPPRKYKIPQGLLKAGENTLVIRVKCERGMGRFTPQKTYAIWNDVGRVNLEGCWKYRIGAACEESPETDFINWKPTGLYQGMTAPCHNYNIAGVLWYQGESNTHTPGTYLDLFTRMVNGYRKKWENEKLPFFYVQLPNFEIDLENEMLSGWPQLRELQRQALSIPNTGMVTTIDVGEDNDLHPLNKKEIGYRLALLAAAYQYSQKVEYSGPIVDTVTVEKKEEKGCLVKISCLHADGIYAGNIGKGDIVKDMELIDKEGNIYNAGVVIEENCLLLTNSEIEYPKTIRYGYKNTPTGAIIYNNCGLPMSPFVWDMNCE